MLRCKVTYFHTFFVFILNISAYILQYFLRSRNTLFIQVGAPLVLITASMQHGMAGDQLLALLRHFWKPDCFDSSLAILLLTTDHKFSMWYLDFQIKYKIYFHLKKRLWMSKQWSSSFCQYKTFVSSSECCLNLGTQQL